MIHLPQYQRVTIDLLLFHLRHAIAEHDLAGLEGTKISVRMDEFARSMIADLEVRLAGHSSYREVERTRRFPKDWWQALRERWFPRWWLKRHPVRYEVVVLKEGTHIYHICPHFRVPDKVPHLQFLMEAKK